jgi:hypothetical protein
MNKVGDNLYEKAIVTQKGTRSEWPLSTYLRRKHSSEKGFDGLRTLDLPRSTFQEPEPGEEARGLDDFSSPDPFLLRRRREPGERLPVSLATMLEKDKEALCEMQYV